jgi:hypothetical protein
MVHFGLLNSRMKDYFDLWVMANTFEFNGEMLAKAIAATFKRRETVLPSGVPEGLSDEFINDKNKQAQWTGFMKRVAEDHCGVTLADVVERLNQFLMPVVGTMAQGRKFSRLWRPKTDWE